MIWTQNIRIMGQVNDGVILLVRMEDHFDLWGNSCDFIERVCHATVSKVDGHEVSRKSLSLPGVHQKFFISEHPRLSRLEGFFCSEVLKSFEHFQWGVINTNCLFSLNFKEKYKTTKYTYNSHY